jgi:hypothetical protein
MMDKQHKYIYILITSIWSTHNGHMDSLVLNSSVWSSPYAFKHEFLQYFLEGLQWRTHVAFLSIIIFIFYEWANKILQ